MKKFIYTLVIVLATGLTITSCTEEEIAPSTENGGGQVDIGKVDL